MTLQPAPPTYTDMAIVAVAGIGVVLIALAFTAAFVIARRLDRRDNWVIPRIPHDEHSFVRPRIRRGWIRRDAGDSTPGHAREYAQQLLAAADAADAGRENGQSRAQALEDDFHRHHVCTEQSCDIPERTTR